MNDLLRQCWRRHFAVHDIQAFIAHGIYTFGGSRKEWYREPSCVMSCCYRGLFRKVGRTNRRTARDFGRAGVRLIRSRQSNVSCLTLTQNVKRRSHLTASHVLEILKFETYKYTKFQLDFEDTQHPVKSFNRLECIS